MIAVNWPRVNAHADRVEGDDSGVTVSVDLGEADGGGRAPVGDGVVLGAGVGVLVTRTPWRGV